MTEPWRNWKAWLLIVSIGCILGLIDASQSFLLLGPTGRSVPAGRLLFHMLIYWMTYAALVPPIFFVASRFRLDGPSRVSRVAVHMGVAFCFVVVHLSLAALSHLAYTDISTARVNFLNMFYSYSAGHFLVYWFIVGIFYALHYYQEARAKELQAANLQAVLTESRLQALRSQLNPHFMFNTLNTIFVLAKKGEQAAVLETITRLSDLLRATTDESRPSEIPLAEELSFLNTYLEIQRTRFSDRLSVEYAIAPETRAALVPTMILQPLVENAIKYGVSGQVGKALLAIRAFCESDVLFLEVVDNGPGFKSEGEKPRPIGIGLANTEARLRYLYGAHHSIRYSPPDVAGAVVTISLPFRTAPDPVGGQRSLMRPTVLA